MKFLHDKRRAGVLTLLTVLLGTTALLVGTGAANASDPYCGTDGDTGDVTFGVSPLFFVAVDTESPGTPSPGSGVWACLVPPNQGGGVGVRDNNTGVAGYQVESATCGAATGGCVLVLEDTGAEVDPATSTNEPYDSTTGTGGSAGAGSGTCVYVDGTSDCPAGGFEVAGLTVNEGDAAVTTVYNNDGPWVTVGGPGGVGVQLPYGFGVMVGRDDANSSANTVDGSVADTVHVTTDVGGCYVSYNTDETTCS